jgi:cytochrome b561
MNPADKYSRTAIALHWVMALLIIAGVVLIWVVDYVPDEQVRWVIDTHKSIGITVLGLTIWRLAWRYTHRPPALPATYSRWEQRASGIAHGLLYALLFLMPLSGWLHDSAWKDAATHPMELFGLFNWPRIGWVMSLEPGLKEQLHTVFGNVHTACGYGLYVLLALHVLAVVKHQWLDHEPELKRMLP